ncbi:hypothetical protein JRO89_XS13G0084000 [Xanthoceras sorbifolium]|uniref:Amino acid transporter transmembrane domain-containing protein n=1 Tax=Xanthoceras sorbifolium TaxID=99658 RepID=A0ABQ8H7B0_9ROSI|nr:hypothetical protein JRO89_XS13G0084000 [Xanthoceras sorbifolium]
METEGPTTTNIEEGHPEGAHNPSCAATSAHTIGHDSWQQVGLMLVTGFNCGYILSFSNLILVPLGWKWGIVCMLALALYTAYALWLLAAFHFINGQRFIRFRDLMGFLYGKSNKHRDYEVKGSKAEQVFNALGAISALVFTNTAGMLPEMQSTLRQPVVKNMRKALYLQFTVGLLFYYGVTIVGYWAYGSSVSIYLPQQINAAKWVKFFLNSAVFLQTIVSQHMFISPVHETLDTKFLKLDESMFSRENIKRRFCVRTILFTGNTLVAAAFPFMGDFVNLIGSFSLIPLTYLFASMVFLKVKAKTATVEKKAWHWFNILLFSLATIATTVAAVRLVIKHIQDYSFFADA